MTKKERVQKRRDVVAKRLSEVIKRKGMTQVALIKKASLMGCTLQASHLSDIKLGKGRNLDNYDADIFSSILDIDPGYLRGDDNFAAASYDDYIMFWVSGKYDSTCAEWKRYQSILSTINCKLVNSYIVDNDTAGYRVRDGAVSATIPAEDFERLYIDVCKYVRKRFDPLIELYRDEV